MAIIDSKSLQMFNKSNVATEFVQRLFVSEETKHFQTCSICHSTAKLRISLSHRRKERLLCGIIIGSTKRVAGWARESNKVYMEDVMLRKVRSGLPTSG